MAGQRPKRSLNRIDYAAGHRGAYKPSGQLLLFSSNRSFLSGSVCPERRPRTMGEIKFWTEGAALECLANGEFECCSSVMIVQCAAMCR
jgi:hypothetical protein